MSEKSVSEHLDKMLDEVNAKWEKREAQVALVMIEACEVQLKAAATLVAEEYQPGTWLIGALDALKLAREDINNMVRE
jgi:hypothetical protein